MKTATTVDDAALIDVADIFDLESAYVDMVRTRPRDNRQGVFHPSAAGMCGRRNVYEYVRAPSRKAHGVQDEEIFAMGHYVHALVQGQIADMGSTLAARGINFKFDAEVPCPEDDQLLDVFGIGGTTDGIIEVWKPDIQAPDGSWEIGWHQRGILEIKSIKDQNYEKLRGPKADHVMQGHLYAYRFNCPIIWIWYFNKNTSQRRVYVVKFDHAILDAALKKYEIWLAHAAAGTLPDREEDFWSCPRCEYQDICKPSIVGKTQGMRANKQLSTVRRRGMRRLGVIR